MKLVRPLSATLALLAAVALLPDRAGAIPVFARKYGFNCTMCHSAFPRLNDFGQRYREGGYAVPGQGAMETTIMDGGVPLAARTSLGYDYDRSGAEGSRSTLSRFEIGGLDLLAAGLLSGRIGFFVAYPPQFESAPGVAGQTGSIESANVLFGLMDRRRLTLRAGRFEPAYTAFSDKRRLSFSPYEIYDLAFPGGPATAETRTGLELAGALRGGFHWAAGWVDGSATNLPEDTPADLYLRVAEVFGAGEGQTRGQRIGLTAATGRARPDVTAGLEDVGLRNYARYGLDASLNARQFNLAVQWLMETDDRDLRGTPSDQTSSGGFAELTFQPMTNFVALARFDMVQPAEDLEQAGEPDVKRITAGARCYLEDHLALHAEYSHRSLTFKDSSTQDRTEDFVTARIDFAF
jgi:hypothetical protein